MYILFSGLRVFIHLGPNRPHIIWMCNHAIMQVPFQIIIMEADIGVMGSDMIPLMEV